MDVPTSGARQRLGSRRRTRVRGPHQTHRTSHSTSENTCTGPAKHGQPRWAFAAVGPGASSVRRPPPPRSRLSPRNSVRSPNRARRDSPRSSRDGCPWSPAMSAKVAHEPRAPRQPRRASPVDTSGRFGELATPSAPTSSSQPRLSPRRPSREAGHRAAVHAPVPALAVPPESRPTSPKESGATGSAFELRLARWRAGSLVGTRARRRA